jgi:hypothetical protein
MSPSIIKDRQAILCSPFYRKIIDLYCKDVEDGNVSSPFGSFNARLDGAKEFRDGDVVCMGDDSRICTLGEYSISSKTYMIICDESQKKLGFGVPSYGHWCASHGIIRVRIEGSVDAGDLIGPNDDGSCSGMVISNVSLAAVIGFALESRKPADKEKLLMFLSQNPYGPYLLRDDPSEDKVREAEQIIRHQTFDTMNMLEHFSSFLHPGSEVGLPSKFQPLVVPIIHLCQNAILPTPLHHVFPLIPPPQQNPSHQAALDRLRQDAQPDRPSAAGTAHTLGHTLGGAAAAAANNKPLRHAVTFGLPLPARLGCPRFQPRRIPAAQRGGAVDAVTFVCGLLGGDGVGAPPACGRAVAVLGPPGAGKSALIAACVHRLRRAAAGCGAAVVWLDASNASTICKGTVSLARALISQVSAKVSAQVLS